MIEKVLDYFKEIKERLANPLIVSFVISWLFINWRVPIGLIFYDNASLKLDGYNSKIHLIDSNFSWWSYIIFPLIGSLTYTFLFPIARNYINAFNAIMNRKGSEMYFKYSKGGKIAVEKYLKLRETYITRIKNLQTAIDEESTAFREVAELKGELETLNIQKKRIDDENKFVRERCDLKNYNGEWKLTFNINDKEQEENVTFSNGNIEMWYNRKNVEQIFKIHSITFNPNSSEYIWIVENPKSQKVYFNFLRPTQGNNWKSLKNFSDGVIIKAEFKNLQEI